MRHLRFPTQSPFRPRWRCYTIVEPRVESRRNAKKKIWPCLRGSSYCCTLVIHYRYEAPYLCKPKRRSRVHPVLRLPKPGRVRGGFVGPRLISWVHLTQGFCHFFWPICGHMLSSSHLSGQDDILSPRRFRHCPYSAGNGFQRR